ncbi:hypothetical protein PMIN02_007851 [Paraphaeosphaeria minitans]|uniref:Uncharacterized protein n=1 Tax=Paraphaeosphaeria minitans TaxID=565426 RepID=A0A9P6KJG8_9PLEO|nr:hypothetical protein PMIN01_13058 [Paraphaeosphaeria minitans]
MPPFSITNSALPLQRRDELEAAQAANDRYNPFKIVLAVLGILAINMLFFTIVWFAWYRGHRQRNKALERQNPKDVAMTELFGSSQQLKGQKENDIEDASSRSDERSKKGFTRWSFSGYFAK